MSNKQVIKAQKISDIKVSDIIVSNKKTGKTVPITYSDTTLVCQTPFLEVKGELIKTPYPNIYQVDTLFKGDSKQKIHKWYQFIENLETHISEQVMNNGSKWFTRKDVVIKSLIRELEAEKGVYFIKWPIDLQTNIFVDEQKNQFNPINLKDKDLIKLIIEVSYLWIDENQCGLAIVVHKILVRPFIEKLQSEYIFDDTDSESDSLGDEKDNKIISLFATEQKPKTQNTGQGSAKQQVSAIIREAHAQRNNARETELPVPSFTQEPQVSRVALPQRNNQREGVLQGNGIIRDGLLINNEPLQLSGKKQQGNVQQKNVDHGLVDEHVENRNRQSKNKNELLKRHDTSVKETLAKQKKQAFEEKELHKQKILGNKQVNGKHLETKTNLQSVFSDENESEDENTNRFFKNERNLKQLLEEYTPSSDDAEINEDDLDFDGDN